MRERLPGRNTLTLLTWLGLGFAGCGGSVETEPSPEPSGVAFEQWQSVFATKLCDSYATCCHEAGLANNREKCISVFAPRVNYADSLDPARYDPELARRCIDTVAGLASSCLLEDLWPSAAKELCAPLFGGARSITELIGATAMALGEDCDSTCARFECVGHSKMPKPAHVCLLAQGLLCGTDQTCQPAMTEGESCRNDFDCVEGLSCIDGQCIERQRTGACAHNGFCTSTSRCIEGQCVPTVITSQEFCAGDF